MIPDHRDEHLENLFQRALDRGRAVWAVGDIHGHKQEFSALLEKMKLEDGDMVMCLGDLIDRGPDSHGVLTIVKDSKQIFSLMGNHEMIMSQALTRNSEKSNSFWVERIGGRETLESMPGKKEDQRKKAEEWSLFVEKLPTELVLNRFRLCHSGYSSRIPLEDQTDEDRLKSREVFLCEYPLDPHRQIIAGHTPVQNLGRFGVEPPVDGIWYSETRIEDGRHSAIIIDTGIALDKPKLRPRISAYNLQSERILESEKLEY